MVRECQRRWRRDDVKETLNDLCDVLVDMLPTKGSGSLAFTSAFFLSRKK